jgi:hypothetical protein
VNAGLVVVVLAVLFVRYWALKLALQFQEGGLSMKTNKLTLRVAAYCVAETIFAIGASFLASALLA